jgi:hypothetical protein
MPGTGIFGNSQTQRLGPVSTRGVMQHRRRVKQTESLKDRLASFAKEAMDKANHLPSGPERDALLKKARQANTASHIDDWANSPGLQPPK